VTDRVVPTEPGWWWRELPSGAQVAVRISEHDELFYIGHGDGLPWPVTDDGRWLAPVLTPDEAATLRARAEAAEAACERMRAVLLALADGYDECERMDSAHEDGNDPECGQVMYEAGAEAVEAHGYKVEGMGDVATALRALAGGAS